MANACAGIYDEHPARLRSFAQCDKHCVIPESCTTAQQSYPDRCAQACALRRRAAYELAYERRLLLLKRLSNASMKAVCPALRLFGSRSGLCRRTLATSMHHVVIKIAPATLT